MVMGVDAPIGAGAVPIGVAAYGPTRGGAAPGGAPTSLAPAHR